MNPEGAFGRYRIEALLGEGAMARVYKAYDARHDRNVALKILKEAWRGDREVLDRFFREARAAGALNHPNIVIIYNVEDQPEPFIDMELVEGPSLAWLLKERGRLPPAQTVTIAKALATALDYAHSHGRVHRDIKPSNVLLASDLLTPKLTDFGIAVIDQPEAAQLTQHGQMLGTPRYMSPEQMRGERADGRSDLFSLGATLYEMLTGRYAFPGETLVALSTQILQHQPLPVLQLAPEAPPQIAAAVERLLEKDPARRFQSGREVVAALEVAHAERRRTGKVRKEGRRLPIGATLGVIGALALAGGLAVLFFLPPPNEPPMAHDDSVTTVAGEPVRIDVLGNDGDPEGDPLIVAGASLSGDFPGTVRIEGDHLIYDPGEAFDSLPQDQTSSGELTYRIQDPSGAVAEAGVRIEVLSKAVPAGDPLVVLVEEAARMPCSRIEVEDGTEGPRLVGYIGAEADRMALVARARGLLGDAAIELQALDGPLPMCPFLNFLADKTLPHVPRLLRLVPPIDGGCNAGAGCYAGLADHRLAEGERLVLEISTPDFPNYATVDYFTADGQVAHLAPAPDLASETVSAEAYQTSRPAGSTFFIGDPRADQRIAYPVSSPFGREMILAVAGKIPLFTAARPKVEPADVYLADLRQALDASSDGRPVASVLILETVARAP